jgi:hypothetical protein
LQMRQSDTGLLSEAETLRDDASFASQILNQDIVRQARRVQFASWATLGLGGVTSLAAILQTANITSTFLTLATSLVTTLSAGFAKFIEQTQKGRIPKLTEGATEFGKLASNAAQMIGAWRAASAKNEWDDGKALKDFAPLRHQLNELRPKFGELGLNLGRPGATDRGSGTGLSERDVGSPITTTDNTKNKRPGGEIPPQLGTPRPGGEIPPQLGTPRPGGEIPPQLGNPIHGYTPTVQTTRRS